jgi:hypothetical protein
VALAVAYFTANTTAISTSTPLYTTPSTGYNRDLVIANGSGAAVYVNTGTGATGATTVASFIVPQNGYVLIGGPVPVSTKIYAIPAAGATAATGTVELGWASVVSVI